MKSFLTAFAAGGMMILGICVYNAHKNAIDASFKKMKDLGCKQFNCQEQTTHSE